MGHGIEADATRGKREWAVILAGGDGTRLRSLTRKISGDERPKQFCRILGLGTLLEQTRERAALEIAPERTIYVLNRLHHRFYEPILSEVPAANLVEQNRNRGTAPAILYSLLRIAAVDNNARVAFFPSDHFISDNRRFMEHIRAAFDITLGRPDLVVLLGLEPENPEVEYGWIEPADSISGHFHVFAVRNFWEKPSPHLAQLLQRSGCLWNSFVMVASVRALLAIIESAIPETYSSFVSVAPFFGTRSEARVVDALYERLETINFSHHVLSILPQRLGVLKVTGVRWSDLGEPRRVMASLNVAGLQPHWADAAVPRFA
jgi:mannose-1-phosphate guanylyltransferase